MTYYFWVLFCIASVIIGMVQWQEHWQKDRSLSWLSGIIMCFLWPVAVVVKAVCNYLDIDL